MPYLEEIRRNNEQHDVQVFAINIKEDGDPAAFANRNDFEFVYLLDGEAVAERYAVRFTPGLFVVDKNGTIVFRRKSTELPPGRQVAEFWAERDGPFEGPGTWERVPPRSRLVPRLRRLVPKVLTQHRRRRQLGLRDAGYRRPWWRRLAVVPDDVRCAQRSNRRGLE